MPALPWSCAFPARGSPELSPVGMQPQRGYPARGSCRETLPTLGAGFALPQEFPGWEELPQLLPWAQSLCAQGNELEQGIQNDS